MPSFSRNLAKQMPRQAAYVEATCNANCIGLVKLTFGSSGLGKLPGLRSSQNNLGFWIRMPDETEPNTRIQQQQKNPME